MMLFICIMVELTGDIINARVLPSLFNYTLQRFLGP